MEQRRGFEVLMIPTDMTTRRWLEVLEEEKFSSDTLLALSDWLEETDKPQSASRVRGIVTGQVKPTDDHGYSDEPEIKYGWWDKDIGCRGVIEDGGRIDDAPEDIPHDVFILLESGRLVGYRNCWRLYPTKEAAVNDLVLAYLLLGK